MINKEFIRQVDRSFIGRYPLGDNFSYYIYPVDKIIRIIFFYRQHILPIKDADINTEKDLDSEIEKFRLLLQEDRLTEEILIKLGFMSSIKHPKSTYFNGHNVFYNGKKLRVPNKMCKKARNIKEFFMNYFDYFL